VINKFNRSSISFQSDCFLHQSLKFVSFSSQPRKSNFVFIHALIRNCKCLPWLIVTQSSTFLQIHVRTAKSLLLPSQKDEVSGACTNMLAIRERHLPNTARVSLQSQERQQYSSCDFTGNFAGNIKRIRSTHCFNNSRARPVYCANTCGRHPSKWRYRTL